MAANDDTVRARAPRGATLDVTNNQTQTRLGVASAALAEAIVVCPPGGTDLQNSARRRGDHVECGPVYTA
jgi:hypothetical protein